jgi:hypothetical protein
MQRRRRANLKGRQVRRRRKALVSRKNEARIVRVRASYIGRKVLARMYAVTRKIFRA